MPSAARSARPRALSIGAAALLLAGLSLTGATAAHALPGDLSTVSGVVVDGSSGALENVAVSIVIPDPGYSDTVLTEHTAADGSFAIAGVPDGTYALWFDLGGYGSRAVDVTVDGADVTVPTVTLLGVTDTSAATATISGTGELGTTLTVTSTGWPTGTVLSYQWFAPTSEHSGDIAGATGDTLVVTTQELGRTVYVWVSGEVPGVSAPNTIVSSNGVLASVTQKPTAPAPTDLDAYLLANGSTPAAQTTAGLPAGPLNPGAEQVANLAWTAQDGFVDVYVFSSPVLVGTFPVTDGVARITLTPAVLDQLPTGTHTLVATGQTSGAVSSLTLSIGLAATGSEPPALPLAIAALALLAGVVLVASRRRRALHA